MKHLQKLRPSMAPLIIVDGDKPSGKIQVTMQPFQCGAENRPTFQLRYKKEDQKWYELFYRQYAKRLWRDAQPVDPSDVEQICR